MKTVPKLALCAALLLATALTPLGAFADEPLRGVALVIGESDYDVLPDLINPERDARSLDRLLDDLGFDVTRVLDGDAGKLRDEIADFVDDAADADVALVYYSGHGVEVAGANYLVPIDTDLSTPQAAGQTLVAVDHMLADLARAVPLTILLLDACRTDAFPAGQLIQLPSAAAPVAVAPAPGLEAMRGPTPTATPNAPADALGTVIGFAASPGQAALDGPAGGNSPYAAALLKHLSAGGYSFGDVMTMVGEEVYLKTEARQLPWVNSSLRRVLSFGTPVNEDDPDRAAIREGRRQLLLTVATAPDATRRFVETVASSEDVPLDALYGMLKVLGVDTSGGAADLEQQLLEGARQIREFKQHQPGAVIEDPELVRLTGLAEEAQSEGAIALALEFREKATARARVLSSDRDQLEAQLAADRLEIAATYGQHAETAALNFDYATAARMFGEAYEEVRRWDDDAALRYKWNEALSLKTDGEMRGRNEPLDASITAYAEALSLAPRASRPADWAGLQNNVGNAYLTLAERSGDGETLQKAIDSFQSALEVSTRETAPEDWAMAQSNLGIALVDLGYGEEGNESFDAAIVAFRRALEVRTRVAAPLDWASTQNNLGIALKVLGDRTGDLSLTRQAAEVFEEVLAVYARDTTPLDWAMTQSNYGNALSVIGKRDPGSGALELAVSAYEAALEEYREDRTPLDWAMVENNLAVTLRAIGERDNDVNRIGAAADIYQSVLASFDRGTAPQTWAMTQNNLAVALSSIASRLSYPEASEESIRAYRAALEVYAPDRNPIEWLSAQMGLANELVALGFMRGDDKATLEMAVTEHRAALEHVDPIAAPDDWGLLHQSMALALDALAQQTGDSATLDEAIASARIGRQSYEQQSGDSATLDEAIASAKIGRESYEQQGLDTADFNAWIAEMTARRAALGP